ncbi:hypothetical protein SAMN04488063_2668 [Halopelagius inordinatus]|uniref:LURP-one-related n=1 Tax=Halopelagius inordinatus TaxID=553467 RepID=A0A1I2TF53_9EURY|nr:hypothetical protein [Halopelagius inordinatus]SFG63490.1 hypothetical protein SAMN04488063_2668 [Halopelagius inordinatus]
MFESTHYEVRQKFGITTKYRVYEDDEPILESKKKKLRLKEDFRFTDADTGTERFRVKADSVLDIAAAYDIVDSETGERVGSVKRSAVSFLKHEYELLGPDGQTVAYIREDSVLKAVIRRNVTTFLPFEYNIESPAGESFGSIHESFSFRDKYQIDLADTTSVDPRLVVVGAVVIDAIEEN